MKFFMIWEWKRKNHKTLSWDIVDTADIRPKKREETPSLGFDVIPLFFPYWSCKALQQKLLFLFPYTNQLDGTAGKKKLTSARSSSSVPTNLGIHWKAVLFTLTPDLFIYILKYHQLLLGLCACLQSSFSALGSSVFFSFSPRKAITFLEILSRFVWFTKERLT